MADSDPGLDFSDLFPEIDSSSWLLPVEAGHDLQPPDFNQFQRDQYGMMHVKRSMQMNSSSQPSFFQFSAGGRLPGPSMSNTPGEVNSMDFSPWIGSNGQTWPFGNDLETDLPCLSTGMNFSSIEFPQRTSNATLPTADENLEDLTTANVEMRTANERNGPTSG